MISSPRGLPLVVVDLSGAPSEEAIDWTLRAAAGPDPRPRAARAAAASSCPGKSGRSRSRTSPRAGRPSTAGSPGCAGPPSSCRPPPRPAPSTCAPRRRRSSPSPRPRGCRPRWSHWSDRSYAGAARPRSLSPAGATPPRWSSSAPGGWRAWWADLGSGLLWLAPIDPRRRARPRRASSARGRRRWSRSPGCRARCSPRACRSASSPPPRWTRRSPRCGSASTRCRRSGRRRRSSRPGRSPRCCSAPGRRSPSPGSSGAGAPGGGTVAGLALLLVPLGTAIAAAADPGRLLAGRRRPRRRGPADRARPARADRRRRLDGRRGRPLRRSGRGAAGRLAAVLPPRGAAAVPRTRRQPDLRPAGRPARRGGDARRHREAAGAVADAGAGGLRQPPLAGRPRRLQPARTGGPQDLDQGRGAGTSQPLRGRPRQGRASLGRGQFDPRAGRRPRAPHRTVRKRDLLGPLEGGPHLRGAPRADPDPERPPLRAADPDRPRARRRNTSPTRSHGSPSTSPSRCRAPIGGTCSASR